jgi:hypothetical protein
MLDKFIDHGPRFVIHRQELDPRIEYCGISVREGFNDPAEKPDGRQARRPGDLKNETNAVFDLRLCFEEKSVKAGILCLTEFKIIDDAKDMIENLDDNFRPRVLSSFNTGFIRHSWLLRKIIARFSQ